MVAGTDLYKGLHREAEPGDTDAALHTCTDVLEDTGSQVAVNHWLTDSTVLQTGCKENGHQIFYLDKKEQGLTCVREQFCYV